MNSIEIWNGCKLAPQKQQQGNPVLETTLTEKGNATFSLDGSMLAAGMYIYALVADGQEVDAKRMILAKGK